MTQAFTRVYSGVRPRLCAIAVVAAIASCGWGQRTTRPQLKVDASVVTPVACDTIIRAKIVVSGYEKTLRSAKESFLVTNESTDTIHELGATIDYLDLEGRQLHRRRLTLTVADPMGPGETRLLEFKSWDSQKVWYYRLSEPPRTKGQATPYDIRIRIDYALKSPAAPKR